MKWITARKGGAALLETLLELHLARKLNPDRIRRHLRRVLQEAVPAPAPAAAPGEPGPAPGLIRVSCVQRRIRPVKRVEEYIDHLHGFVRRAAEQGSRLVVFPEYNFFDLFGLLPGFALADRILTAQAQRPRKAAPAEEAEEQGQEQDQGRDQGQVPGRGQDQGQGRAGESGGGLFHTLFSAMARPAERAILTIMTELAKGYGLYIYTGSYLLKMESGLYSAGSLISPEGMVVGTQKKLHLVDFEAGLGLSRGAGLAVHDLAGIGRVAFPVCMDATYFETFRLAGRLGAEIVIIPIANNEEYHVWKALRGIWPRVQESYVFGLKASLNGWLGGMHFTGKAGVFAPIPMTERRDGVLALARHFEGGELVTADLDREALRRTRAEAEYFGDENPAFEANYYGKTYGKKI